MAFVFIIFGAFYLANMDLCSVSKSSGENNIALENSLNQEPMDISPSYSPPHHPQPPEMLSEYMFGF